MGRKQVLQTFQSVDFNCRQTFYLIYFMRLLLQLANTDNQICNKLDFCRFRKCLHISYSLPMHRHHKFIRKPNLQFCSFETDMFNWTLVKFPRAQIVNPLLTLMVRGAHCARNFFWWLFLLKIKVLEGQNFWFRAKQTEWNRVNDKMYHVFIKVT